MGYRLVSSRLVAIRLGAVPFNMTVVQAYALTLHYDDNETEKNLRPATECFLIRHKRRTFLLCKETEKVGTGAYGNWQGI